MPVRTSHSRATPAAPSRSAGKSTGWALSSRVQIGARGFCDMDPPPSQVLHDNLDPLRPLVPQATAVPVRHVERGRAALAIPDRSELEAERDERYLDRRRGHG